MSGEHPHHYRPGFENTRRNLSEIALALADEAARIITKRSTWLIRKIPMKSRGTDPSPQLSGTLPGLNAKSQHKWPEQRRVGVS